MRIMEGGLCVLSVGVGAGGEGVEMITINKGLAGVISDFIRQREWNQGGRGRFLCSGNFYRSCERSSPAPPPLHPHVAGAPLPEASLTLSLSVKTQFGHLSF